MAVFAAPEQRMHGCPSRAADYPRTYPLGEKSIFSGITSRFFARSRTTPHAPETAVADHETDIACCTGIAW
jgi:hypothetical protein